jgi:MerR family transcriptional regulator, light-induced transcriptional regulator
MGSAFPTFTQRHNYTKRAKGWSSIPLPRFQHAKLGEVEHTWGVSISAEASANGVGETRANASSSSPMPEAENTAQIHELALTVSVVARRLGVAPATLRTWDRRYGLGPSAHREGSHRRYLASDLAKLEYMRSLVLAGVPAAEAANKALTLEVTEEYSVTIARSITPMYTPEETSETSTTVPRGGGNVVATPGADQGARGLARAATALDSQACREIICRGIATHGVIPTWNQLIVPVLRGVGERWQSSGKGIDIEHVLSSTVESALGSIVNGTTAFTNPRPVMLAGANNERHQLPLWALAATLAEANIRTLMMGSGMPVDALGEAVTKTGPAAVFIWSQIGPSDLAELDRLPVTRPSVRIVVGGPGWVGAAPSRVERIMDLESASTVIQRAVCSL